MIVGAEDAVVGAETAAVGAEDAALGAKGAGAGAGPPASSVDATSVGVSLSGSVLMMVSSLSCACVGDGRCERRRF
jgi:hypothetical protein